MKYYYPELKEKLKLKFIGDANKIVKPWSFLEYYYLIDQNNSENYLYIPSNTQISEFLNKFNESHILPILGKIKFNELKNGSSQLGDLDLMVKDYGWNWINWVTEPAQNVLDELIKVKSQMVGNVNELSNQTLKILGRIRLKESTDYGKEVEKSINEFITNDLVNKKYEWEINFFIKLLEENNFIILEHNQHFVHPKGMIQGEIDYILMDKTTKKIYISDLKTATSADKIDYWRQLGVYKKTFEDLNPHLKGIISDELIIFHINEKKNIHKIYRKNIEHTDTMKSIKLLIQIREKYLQEMLEYEKKII